jgi:hypothetical protein
MIRQGPWKISIRVLGNCFPSGPILRPGLAADQDVCYYLSFPVPAHDLSIGFEVPDTREDATAYLDSVYLLRRPGAIKANRPNAGERHLLGLHQVVGGKPHATRHLARVSANPQSEALAQRPVSPG